MTQIQTLTIRRLSDGTVSLVTENTNLIARTPDQVQREVEWFVKCAAQQPMPATTKPDVSMSTLAHGTCGSLIRDALQYLDDPDLVPPSRAASLARTKLEEALFWASQAVKG